MAAGTFAFSSLAELILPKHCQDEFLINFNYLHAACLKIALSKCLGYSVVALAVIVKLPQIIKVLRASSVKGLNVLSFLTELMTQTATFSYSAAKGFPFSSWGESVIKASQTSFVILLCFYYTNRHLAALLFPLLYGAIIYVLVSGIMPMFVLTQLVSLNVLFLSISRVLQIVTNFRNGHTGQLSFGMVFMMLYCHAVRIFTTLQETGDSYILRVFVLSTIFNVTMVTQILYYWNVKVDTQKKET
ncbi:mannose-P-dolichol utilization defect 1 protein-like [Montipora capricornis]|uniref:mannose-P-dolichol utilization defect 1 protein-like n=1 Tax=Montipora foliosa TaxID=591990 RepID=UPI0035F21B8F